MISLECLKLELSNFCTQVGCIKYNFWMKTTLKRGVVRVTWSILNFDARNHISRTAEATVAKFCVQVEYIKCWLWEDRLPPKRHGQGNMTHFLIFSQSYHILELLKLGTSNFVFWLIHRSTRVCIIYYPLNGSVQSHVTSLNFGK